MNCMKNLSAGFVFLGFAFTVFISCKHEIPVNPNNPPGGGGNTDTSVCFKNDILPIFQSRCAFKSGCHNATDRTEGYQLDSYDNIVAKGIDKGNAANSKIYKVITEDNPDKIMPKAPNTPLTAAQKALIARWINEGANNTANCSASCDSSSFTYSNDVKPILETHCLGCHGGTAASGGYINMDTYDGLKQQVKARTLYPAITHTGTDPMPKNGDKLSDCKIAVIRKWIDAGTPNN
jgi:uncharacterized membrane protein